MHRLLLFACTDARVNVHTQFVIVRMCSSQCAYIGCYCSHVLMLELMYIHMLLLFTCTDARVNVHTWLLLFACARVNVHA